MQRLTINTPTGPLEYTVTYRSRVKKRLHMELDESGGLVVVAPQHWSRTHIKATLAQNTPRVERFLLRARQRHLPALRYASGEQHLYLGVYYPLVIRHVKTGENNIVVNAGELHIGTSALQRDKIQKSLQNWYLQQAKTVLGERLRVIARRAEWVGDNLPPLMLRRMKRTWGNCSSKGVIKLNTHLIKAPLDIIDSVIAHELCHLQEMNHGTEFYKLLESMNPDWRADRAVLRSKGFTYLLT